MFFIKKKITRNCFFFGQNLKHIHMTWSFLEVLIFTWLTLINIYCLRVISHCIKKVLYINKNSKGSQSSKRYGMCHQHVTYIHLLCLKFLLHWSICWPSGFCVENLVDVNKHLWLGCFLSSFVTKGLMFSIYNLICCRWVWLSRIIFGPYNSDVLYFSFFKTCSVNFIIWINFPHVFQSYALQVRSSEAIKVS